MTLIGMAYIQFEELIKLLETWDSLSHGTYDMVAWCSCGARLSGGRNLSNLKEFVRAHTSHTTRPGDYTVSVHLDITANLEVHA